MAGLPVEKWALLSVTNKSGLESVARALLSHDYGLLASGGTARFLAERGLAVTEVSARTDFPEVFGGRVKTLHPIIQGGILAPDRDSFAEVQGLGIEPIDVVIVNLYQFQEAIGEGADEAQAIEKIDIGGPTLLRAAAKNHQRVTVVSDPAHYPELIRELAQGNGVPGAAFRRRMAAATFRLVTDYDQAISTWFAGENAGAATLRYGENPHQEAILDLPGGLAGVGVVQHGGKDLSYNNIVDLVAAVKLVGDFPTPCCGILKHTNPCGFGLGAGRKGLERALLCDPVSAFGGVFAFNTELDLETAEILAKRFLEIIVAPGYTAEALARLTRKQNVRVLTVDQPRFLAATRGRSRGWGKLVLRQDEDEGFPELEHWKLVAGEKPDPETRRALEMVWKVCKHGKSNAIVLGNLNATLGLGFGQMSRVDSTRLAVLKAETQNLDLRGCLAASDGFFPFPDGVEKLAEAGARAIIAPGGSIRDEEVAARARELGVTLILTDRRHFNH
ncbi:bifunctional phosphoribosylaminoimidazolecarboxamide formyltransferase/IMP cyclohydrolase PurH [bacterium DOLZORAL124_64_63]|nr:MAG: bifunctional phosphoribosylaminoimidazolecarboxamide formyltransferase/IMP cyclohydrolase PurH [bacterium DOLZORAL124_64_63]